MKKARILFFTILTLFIAASILVSVTGAVKACATPTAPPTAPPAQPPSNPTGGGGSNKPVVPVSDHCYVDAKVGKELVPMGESHIFKFSLNAAHTDVLTNIDITPIFDGNVFNPSIDPKNICMLVFAGKVNGATNTDLYLVPTSGMTTTQITNTPDDENYPNWTPLGTIVYQRGLSEIWQMIDDGTNPHVLYDGKDPLTSPDGKYIAYEDKATGALMYYEMSSGKAYKEPYTPTLIVNWAWDGSKLAYADADGLEALDFSTGQVTNLGKNWSDAAWDPTAPGLSGLVIVPGTPDTTWWMPSPSLLNAGQDDWKDYYHVPYDPTAFQKHLGTLPVQSAP